MGRKADTLARYYESIGLKTTKEMKRVPYDNMGATVIDAILQSGMSYQSVVLPRVRMFLDNYSHYRTTCDFLILMNTIPLKELIDWSNKEKLWRIFSLSWFLYNHDIQTEKDLGNWIIDSDNRQKMMQLSGVGKKTVDYLMSLIGIESVVAIDRHLLKFLKCAGIDCASYDEAKQIYVDASSILGISPYQIDKQVWRYMSNTLVL